MSVYGLHILLTFRIHYDHLVYICCGHFGIVFPFWYAVPRKIWQPCSACLLACVEHSWLFVVGRRKAALAAFGKDKLGNECIAAVGSKKEPSWELGHCVSSQPEWKERGGRKEKGRRFERARGEGGSGERSD
jgi:hypothetical protein